MRILRIVLVAIATVAAAAAVYAFRPVEQDEWQADYLEFRDILANSYANLGYASETGVSLAALDSAARAELSNVRTVRGARSVLSRFVSALEDPHLKLESGPPEFVRYLSNTDQPSAVSGNPADACQAMGYEGGIGNGFSLPFEELPGFKPVGSQENTFGAGSVPAANGKRVGLIRISLFSPHRSRAHCMKAWSERQAKTPSACAGDCQDSIYYRTGALLAEALRTSVVALERDGVSSILVDIGGNGGGSEWVSLAVRAITNAPLFTPPVLVTNQAKGQRCKWEEAIARRCSNLAAARPDSETVAAFAQRRDSVPGLPIFVLVDAHTASASEYFAAVLQDSKAAQVIGTRTMGAGCGYVDGGGKYTLPRTHLRFRAPNCVRLRKDGSNERAGIRPDIDLGAESTGIDRARRALDLASETQL